METKTIHAILVTPVDGIPELKHEYFSSRRKAVEWVKTNKPKDSNHPACAFVRFSYGSEIHILNCGVYPRTDWVVNKCSDERKRETAMEVAAKCGINLAGDLLDKQLALTYQD